MADAYSYKARDAAEELERCQRYHLNSDFVLVPLNVRDRAVAVLRGRQIDEPSGPSFICIQACDIWCGHCPSTATSGR